MARKKGSKNKNTKRQVAVTVSLGGKTTGVVYKHQKRKGA